ncbi:MAG: DUF4838 domain-containing protein [Verrucomicrobia bacterium]|nr:DUF4838 domain-containing protein [Verrucomicrobiota bacterium]
MNSFFIGFLTIGILALPLHAGLPVLVEDGAGKAAIVVAANEAQAQRAAEEIRAHLEKMSGAKLPIVVEGQPAATDTKIRLLVGHTTAARNLGVNIPAGFDPTIRPEAFEEEGYVLKTLGSDVVIGGNSDGTYQGTLYAAYAFLEQLGCRWYFPGKWGEVVPQRKTIPLPALDVRSRPDFPIRMIWLSGWVEPTAAECKLYEEWCARIGFSGWHPNLGLKYPLVGDGFLGHLLPPAEYFEKNPALYAVGKGGIRKITKDTDVYHTMLCLSNPEVLVESVKSLKAAFAGQKKLVNVSANGVGISPPDGAPYCYCTNCLAQSQNFNYPTYMPERMQSEEFFGFAAKLAQEFPDKWVSTMAYALRDMPPQGVKLPPNVAVMCAPITCDVLHANNDPRSWRRREFVSMLKQWRRLTPHVDIRDYNPGLLAGCFLPERDVANMAINVPLYKEIGIKGMGREGRKAFMQTWISYYVTAKLLWDSKADVAAIKRDFYDTFFGPEAGRHVQAWWDACEEALGRATIQAHEDWLLNHIYTVEFTGRIHKHVEAARKSKMTEDQRQRAEAFALIADHLEANAEMEEADKNMDYPRAVAAAGRMMADQKKLHEIDPFLIGPTRPKPFFADGRKKKYEELAATSGGDKGVMIAPLPLEMRFARDRFNEGVVAEWYAADFNDRDWKNKNTFFLWDQQDPPEDAAGHDYDGYGWYRGTVEIPAEFTGKPVHFWCGGAMNEAWVWINGEYAGHREHRIWWRGPHDFDLDVTKLAKPGKNVIVIRVGNDAEFGGLFRRGFFWSPKLIGGN